MTSHESFAEAAAALKERDGVKLIRVAQKLIESEQEPLHASGYLLRGGAFEYGVGDVEKDLQEAVANYRKSAALNPGPIPHWYLGRALLKQGRFDEANDFLTLASSEGAPMDIHVDLGRLHESGPHLDHHTAARHYVTAALRGRRPAINGYIRVLRANGKKIRAAALDGFFLLMTPLLRLVIGKKFETEF